MGDTLGDTWEWDGSAWTQVADGGPPSRLNPGMATIGGKVVLFGGDHTNVCVVSCPESLSDTWTWDGTLWTEQHVAGPSPRAELAMAGFRGSVLLYGGVDSRTEQIETDTWRWDGKAWTEVPVTGPPFMGVLGIVAAR
jgi:hypothetical protein